MKNRAEEDIKYVDSCLQAQVRHYSPGNFNKLLYSEAYANYVSDLKMELFAEMVNAWKPLTNFEKKLPYRQ